MSYESLGVDGRYGVSIRHEKAYEHDTVSWTLTSSSIQERSQRRQTRYLYKILFWQERSADDIGCQLRRGSHRCAPDAGLAVPVNIEILLRRLERRDPPKAGGSRAAHFPPLSGRMRQGLGMKLADLLRTHGLCGRE